MWFYIFKYPNSTVMNTVNKGKQGEDLAAAYLQKKGYRIWARNVYYQKAEIDIIAQKKDLYALLR